MMKKLPWLPEYAKAEDASTFLEVATGEAWPLARILEAGAGAFVLIAPPEGTPQAVIDAVLGGRSGGFYGPILRQDDLHRLVSSPDDAAMHMTQTPEGRVINFNPPARFTSAEVRLYAADVRRIAEMFPDHEVTPSRHSETLRLDGFDVTFAEGHSLRQLMHLHGDIARIDLVESPPVAQSPEPAPASATTPAPSAPAEAEPEPGGGLPRSEWRKPGGTARAHWSDAAKDRMKALRARGFSDAKIARAFDLETRQAISQLIGPRRSG